MASDRELLEAALTEQKAILATVTRIKTEMSVGSLEETALGGAVTQIGQAATALEKTVTRMRIAEVQKVIDAQQAEKNALQARLGQL